MKFKTKCGGAVVVPWGRQQHLRAHPDVLDVLDEAISKIELPTDGESLKTTVDLGRVIGRAGAVETDPIQYDEPAWFAHRIGRDGPSRVVLDTEGPEVSTVAVLASQAKDRGTGEIQPGKYTLVTAWVGSAEAEREPWDKGIKTERERQAALRYWCSHALVYDKEVMGEPFQSSWKEILEG